MFDSDDGDLHAAVMALRDIVMPAVDAGNPIAQQQLKFVIDYLVFHRRRRRFQPWLDRSLLRAHLEMARQVAACVPKEIAIKLSEAIASGERQAEENPDLAELTRAQVTLLENEIAELARTAAGLEPQLRDDIYRTVIKASKPIVDLQRAWNAPLSIESDLASLIALEEALGLPPHLRPEV